MEEKNLNPIENEKAVLLDFQRAAHHYYAATPTADQVVDWLALMQHHGAPTRLLDWTRSSYVALYFAMENDSEGDSALWAIDLDWFEQRSNKLLCQQKDSPGLSDFTVRCKYVNQILLRDDNLLNLVSVSPLRLSERMLAQQGQLLCSVRHEFSFSAGLLAMLLSPPIVDQQVVSKVLVKKDRRIEFLEELRRMNIHSASLFPGLDGFARSLSVNLEIALSHQIEDRKQAMNEENREAVRGLKSIGIEW